MVIKKILIFAGQLMFAGINNKAFENLVFHAQDGEFFLVKYIGCERIYMKLVYKEEGLIDAVEYQGKNLDLAKLSNNNIADVCMLQVCDKLKVAFDSRL